MTDASRKRLFRPADMLAARQPEALDGMTPRQVVLAAFRHQRPDRVPKSAGLSPYLMEIFKDKTGSDSPDDYWDFECRDVSIGPTRLVRDFSQYYPEEVRARVARQDEWGVGYLPSSSYHFEDYVHPLAGLTTLDELEAFPWPDCTAPYRREGVAEKVKDWQARGYAVRGWPPMLHGTIFENAWMMRGLENLLTDFLVNEEFAELILDKLTVMQIDGMRFVAECGVDVVACGDDVGTQRGMMMSPALWRKWLKPRLASAIAAARAVKPEVHVWYHSDGNVMEIVPELIEIGVDVLNPVQPECMDPLELKRRFGKRLSFWGTIGTQTTMPFGTPQDVRQAVKRMIETVGVDGGLLLAPTHVLEPDVPWENVVAFFDAVREFGKSF